MTWFAGSRHTEETREIKRIIKITKTTAAATDKAQKGRKLKAKSRKGAAKSTPKVERAENKTTQSDLLFCRLPQVDQVPISVSCNSKILYGRSHMFSVVDARMWSMTPIHIRCV